MEKEILITYEALFEFLVKEKGKEEIQKIDPAFYSMLAEYLMEKKSFYQKDSREDRENTGRQIQNITRMTREFYERREKKILNIALIKSKTGSNLIDTSNLIEEEKMLFSEITSILDKYRGGILNNVVNAKAPEIPSAASAEAFPQKADSPSKRLIRILVKVPKFYGRELEIYGPFEKDDIVIVPAEIAGILIKKKGAEEIEGLE